VAAQETQDVQVTFTGIRSNIVKTTYPAGGATALLLIDDSDGSPVITASINVAGVSEKLPKDTLVLKTYSEHQGLLPLLEDEGVVEHTGQSVPTGYELSPIVRLTRRIPDYL
jgi:hypothetical protein